MYAGIIISVVLTLFCLFVIYGPGILPDEGSELPPFLSDKQIACMVKGVDGNYPRPAQHSLRLGIGAKRRVDFNVSDVATSQSHIRIKNHVVEMTNYGFVCGRAYSDFEVRMVTVELSVSGSPTAWPVMNVQVEAGSITGVIKPNRSSARVIHGHQFESYVLATPLTGEMKFRINVLGQDVPKGPPPVLLVSHIIFSE